MNLIDDVIGFVVGRLKVAGYLLDLARLEARLCLLSIVPAILLILLLAIVTISIWVSLLILFGYFIMWLSDNFWITLLGVIGLQVLLVAGIIVFLFKNLKKMQFLKTRAFLKREQPNYERKTQSRIGNSRDRKKVVAKSGES